MTLSIRPGKRFLLLGLLLLTIATSGRLAQAIPFGDQKARQDIFSNTILQSAGQSDANIVEVNIPTSNSGPNAIVAGAGDTFWFAEFGTGQIGEYTPSNASHPFREYKIPETNATPATVAFNQQTDTVWFTDQKQGAGSVWMFDPAKQLSTAFTRYNTTVPNSIPVYVLVDSLNDIWFTELVGNKLGKLSYPSYALTEYTLPTPSSGPAEMAFQTGSQGQLIIWLTETYAYKIARFDTAAVNTGPWREYTPSIGVRAPVGIVIDGNGIVWFSEHGGSAIVRLDPSTSEFTKYPTSLPPNYDISAPATLNLDSSGRLWFVEHFLNRVGRLNPASYTIDEFNIPTSGSSLLAYSLQSTLDQSGNFYFTEYYANKIGMVPANASAPIAIQAIQSRVSDTAGGRVTVGLTLANKLSIPVHVGLGVSSSFTLTGATTSNRASINATSVDLGPMSTSTVTASVTPDLFSPSGLYSVSISATYGNSSSVGIGFVQVAASIPGILLSYLPVIGILAAVAVGGFYLYYRRRRQAQLSPSASQVAQEAGAFPTRVAIVVALLLLITRLVTSSFPVPQLPPYVNAKCPGLPPPSPGQPPYSIPFAGGQIPVDYGEILDIASIAFFAVVLLLALRKWRHDRKAKKTP